VQVHSHSSPFLHSDSLSGKIRARPEPATDRSTRLAQCGKVSPFGVGQEPRREATLNHPVALEPWWG
jgi:hypothetical protein